MRIFLLCFAVLASLDAGYAQEGIDCSQLHDYQLELQRIAAAHTSNAGWAMDYMQKCSDTLAAVEIHQRQQALYEYCQDYSSAIAMDGLIRMGTDLAQSYCNN